MSRLQHIDKNDHLRPLLTEVLPYETPLWFSNSVLHRICKNNPTKFDSLFNGKFGALKPLDYRIRRTKSGTRTLSIMHPVVQIMVCSFYSEFADLVTYYCKKSPCSLRYPSKIASSFKNKSPFRLYNSDQGVEEEGRDSLHSSSYFTYGKYSFLYRFYESYEYQTLEKKYKHMTQVDVAQCFHGIYTHSISWATKNKRIAKQDKSAKGGFDREFDSLMQNSNYMETNGIIIGPEISRIFAEIILQEIDTRIINRLSEKKIIRKHNYDFRRYVDDFFVFTNDDKTFNTFELILEEELAFFKLHLNSAKTEQIRRPFITNISIFKLVVSKEIDGIFLNRIKEDGTLSRAYNPSVISNKFITTIKAAVKQHDVKYASVSNYLLSVINRKINSYLGEIKAALSNSRDIKDAYKWILVDLDLVFFIHAMDPRIVPTDKIAKIVYAIIESTETLFPEEQDILQKKIFDLGRKSIEIFDDGNDLDFPVEILNILLILSKLDNSYLLPSDFLEKHFIEKSLRDFNCDRKESYDSHGGAYFLWITLMLYISNNSSYDGLRADLVKMGTKHIQSCPIGLRSTETFLFFLDYISCPHIEEAQKLDLIQTIITKEKGLNMTPRRLLQNFGTHGIVVDWQDANWLKKSLLKREYFLAYE